MLYTGVDIVEIKRIGEILERHPAFIERFFTQTERKYFYEKKLAAQYIAAGFSAKEAVSKCIGGFYGFKFKDIEIIRGGRPVVLLWGNAKAKAHLLGIRSISLSISHENDYAVAFAVAQGDEQDVCTNG